MRGFKILLLSALSLMTRPTAASAGYDILSDPGLSLSILPKERTRSIFSARKPSGSIAQLNRHTGQPHEHRREIARNLRRQRPA